MIEGKKVIAFTPCGRRRYMNLLAAHLKREHDRGHIDKWVVFQNAFTWEDVAFAEQLAAHFPWVEAVQPQDGRKGLATPFTAHLSDFYKWMPRENDAIYDGLSRRGVRLISFAPILKHAMFPLAEILIDCSESGV